MFGPSFLQRALAGALCLCCCGGSGSSNGSRSVPTGSGVSTLTASAAPRAPDPPPIASAPAPRSAPSDLDDFVSKSWPKVSAAQTRLVADPARLPDLVALLDRTDAAPLEDTADLIYPGARNFYGHGLVVSYGLDSIAWRAGWAIEEMAFQRFGFQVPALGPPPSGPPRVAIERAKAWAKEHPRLDRYTALKEALESDDPGRISDAIQWIRYGTSPIAGFDRARYERELLPLVQKAARSRDEGSSKLAKQLLSEDLSYAISLKTRAAP